MQQTTQKLEGVLRDLNEILNIRQPLVVLNLTKTLIACMTFYTNKIFPLFLPRLSIATF
jgi:hypothetical protein